MPNSGWETLRWEGGTDGRLVLLDQTLLPTLVQECVCTSEQEVWQAIKRLSVRGAPAIGIAAAYGVVLGLQQTVTEDPGSCAEKLEQVISDLQSCRPTAVNLSWALRRMRDRAAPLVQHVSAAEVLHALLDEARAIHEADRAICHAMGRHGATLLEDGMGVLTHCNAGSLATSEYGTALAVIYAAREAGKRIHVYADETRPLLQGARLTAWELMQRGVEVTLICDSMAAQVMREGRVQAVITGADRITANGDTANKIGTYGVALLARAHNLPFYVAAPSSTFDLSLTHGDQIPIEQRPAHEITCGLGKQTAPDGVQVYNPAFDVTPAQLITAMITERGILTPVTADCIRALL
jgi:methylthioribose-1-phosphate isomerase